MVEITGSMSLSVMNVQLHLKSLAGTSKKKLCIELKTKSNRVASQYWSFSRISEKHVVSIDLDKMSLLERDLVGPFDPVS